MAQDLIINSEYVNLLPQLSVQQCDSLKRSIKENGQHAAIFVNRHNVILDGHHRFRICKELGIKPLIIVKSFDNLDQEKLFVIECNLQRRQLNAFQRAELALKLKPILQAIVKKNESLGGKGVECQTPLVRVDSELGKYGNVGKDTVRKVETILDKASPTLIEKARLGQKTVNKAFTLTQKELRTRQKEEEEAQTYSTSNSNDKNKESICKFELFNDDFRNVHLKANSINLIFTDPPYEDKWLPNYADLAKLAAETLVPNGSLVTYYNQSQLPEILGSMKKAGLVYCHIIPVILDNTYPRNFPRGIVYKHKPLLWCIKGTREEDSDHISDVIYSRKPAKDDIDWQQSSVEVEHVIARLTRANGKDIVFDPMMGSGTTGSAAIKLSRKFIGIDKDLKTFQIAKTNIGKFASSGLGLSSSLASKLASVLYPIAGKDWRN